MIGFVGGVGVTHNESRTACCQKRRGLVRVAEKKSDRTSYTLNIAEGVMVNLEGETLSSIAGMPFTALQGIGAKSEEVLSQLGFKTVSDLANYKFYKIARSCVVLEAVEREGKRPEKSEMNIDKAVDKEYEPKTLKEICDAPTEALQGISAEKSKLWDALGVTSVRKLAAWKFFGWAEAICELSSFEEK